MKQSIYFLLSGSEISHVLLFDHLDRLPMKLSLFSRFLELEEGLVTYLRWQIGLDNLNSAINNLSPNHLQALHTKYVQDKGEDTDDPLILLDYTSFADRKEMVKRFPRAMNMLPFETRSDLNHFFFEVQKLRNRIAHSGPICNLYDDAEELSNFISDLDATIAAFHELNKSLYDINAPGDIL